MKSGFSYADYVFLSIISIRKGKKVTFCILKTSLSRNFVYNLQTFRGFCQVHFTILLQIQQENNFLPTIYSMPQKLVCLIRSFPKNYLSVRIFQAGRRTFIGGLESFTWLFVSSEIAHFTVTGENEAGVDLVLIQPSCFFIMKSGFFILTTYFQAPLSIFRPLPTI